MGTLAVATRYWSFLLSGILTTFLVVATSLGFGFVIGLFTAIARLSRFRILRAIAGGYVDFFRGTPALIILVWIYFVLPILIGVSLSPLPAGILALSLVGGAFLAEVFRTGIRSVERGQGDAAEALGMTSSQVMRRVILPQAIVRMLPPLVSIVVALFKESALVSVIGVSDLMRQGLAISAFTFRPFEALTVVAFAYLLITYPFTVIANVLHRRLLAH